MFVVSVVDTRDGAVVATTNITSLNSRTWKRALQRINVSTKGIYKENPDATVVYVKDTTLDERDDDSLDEVAKLLRRYQAPQDTCEYGVEYPYFHDLYLTEHERTQLLHSNEQKAQEHEKKLQDAMTCEQFYVSHAIHVIRQREYAVCKPIWAWTQKEGA